MFENVRFPAEIVLKPDAKARLPHGMANAEHIYLAENIRPGSTFMRICADSNGDGIHTTVETGAMNLKQTICGLYA